MNLILVEPDELRDGSVTLYDERATHLMTVLDVEPGRPVRIGLVNGPLGTASVTGRDDQSVTLACSFEPTPPPRPGVDLLLALPRPKVMRRLWAQLAALGVNRILLTNAERVERNYFDTHVLAPDVFQPLLLEGLQQARDTHVPDVSIHRQLKVLIEDRLDTLVPDATRLVAHPGADVPIRDALAGKTGERCLIAVGPEGGWNAYELGLLEAHGFKAVSLGVRPLRADTACVALLTLVHDALAR